MVATRRIIALSIDADQRGALVEISRSRTEPANRVERARILLAYLDDPSAYAVARRMGVTHQTVTRCLERAAELGALAALDDRARSGREPAITAEARVWLVALACAKPTQFGYPHELWTTRLLTAHARDHGPRAGHPSLAQLAQGTVCKILAAHEVKPHKVRYYLERRDPEFEPKMAEVLCVYREVELRRAAGGAGTEPAVAIVSYDGKPGIQAIGTTAPDLPPVPGTHPTISRDHEYKRHGTVTLMAGIDLFTGQVHALVKDRHRSREFIEFLNTLDAAYPADTAIKIILDNHSAHISRETKVWLAARPEGRFQFVFTPKHGSWLNLVEGFFAKAARSVLRHIRVTSKHELEQRIMEFINDLNRDPVVHRWRYQIAAA
jgi:transposase